MRVCVEELEALSGSRTHRAWKLGEEIGSARRWPAFDAWSREWEQRVDDLSRALPARRLGARAARRSRGRAELARARDAVLALHRAYRAQVNRFAAEEADLARGAADAWRPPRAAIEPK